MHIVFFPLILESHEVLVVYGYELLALILTKLNSSIFLNLWDTFQFRKNFPCYRFLFFYLLYFFIRNIVFSSVQFTSVAQLCLTLCDPMNHSTPGLPVHHQLPELTQTHVHRVSDAIQPSHPVVPFSSCPQTLPASESFPMSQLFA